MVPDRGKNPKGGYYPNLWKKSRLWNWIHKIIQIYVILSLFKLFYLNYKSIKVLNSINLTWLIWIEFRFKMDLICIEFKLDHILDFKNPKSKFVKVEQRQQKTRSSQFRPETSILVYKVY